MSMSLPKVQSPHVPTLAMALIGAVVLLFVYHMWKR